MIRIELLEHDIHRNETSFRPFVALNQYFKEVGIEFTTGADSYDFAMVGQASLIDKKKPLEESIEKGVNFLDKITGDYIVFDGQDSTSLIGMVDVFRHVYKNKNCVLYLKQSYLKDFDQYKKGWVNGRIYWGEGDYATPDIDDMKPKMKLSGTNWLWTYIVVQPPKFHPLFNKSRDVSAMFQVPLQDEVYEHELLQTTHYNEHRQTAMDILNKTNYNVAKLVDGQRLPYDEYIKEMFYSKIIFSPFGFGELPHRDFQSCEFGNVLLKPSVEYIWTDPTLLVDGETYVAVKHDWSDLEEKIKYILGDYDNIRKQLVETMRERFLDLYSAEKVVLHWYKLLENIESVGIV